MIAISNLRLAQAFVDYMATRNVALEVRPDAQGAEIWLADDEQLPQVQLELEQFLLDPLNPRYQAASWQSGSLHTNLPYQRFSYLQTLRSQAGPLTLAVLVLCITIYILMQIFGDYAVMSWLAWPRDSSQYLQVWRWVSLPSSTFHCCISCLI